MNLGEKCEERHSIYLVITICQVLGQVLLCIESFIPTIALQACHDSLVHLLKIYLLMGYRSVF